MAIKSADLNAMPRNLGLDEALMRQHLRFSTEHLLEKVSVAFCYNLLVCSFATV